MLPEKGKKRIPGYLHGGKSMSVNEETRRVAMALVYNERDRQESLYPGRDHQVGSFITILHKELREAEDAWCDSELIMDTLVEIVHVAAVAVACLEYTMKNSDQLLTHVLKERYGVR